ncbi:MAG: acyclic terpene utilization AtuA family protein [Nitrospirae bacterium]|nr:acyclic terpene utilization AtuA family protein [Magnetococcales bacterium]HAT49168.1 3-methylaspartate ammonia-lyase [Alphaproteobacteria bacterium]
MLKILSPTAILGYSFPDASLDTGMRQRPDVLAVDGGSTDPGPFYLGSGKPFVSRQGVKHDLERLLKAQAHAQIPLIIGTAGGSGARPHLDWTLDIIREIAQQQKRTYRIGVIPADFDHREITTAFQENRLTPLANVPPVTQEAIDSSTHIVAQMGSEPVVAALKEGFDIIVCGRCYDPVPFAALALVKGMDPGLALHLGKILECSAIAALPGSGSDCVMGILDDDGFTLESLNPARRFTQVSVAAHSLYEKSDPLSLPGPGGVLDLSHVTYRELDQGRVRVQGSRFVADATYRIKLEAARLTGYRTISIAGVRDPGLIAGLDDVLEKVIQQCRPMIDPEAKIHFHVYGRNGVMGSWEPHPHPGHELGLVLEVMAPQQALADGACALLRSTLLHYGFPGRLTTAGNLAFPYSPSDVSVGAAYEFSLYHLMAIADPKAHFPLSCLEIHP